MKIFSAIFRELNTPDNQNRDWYGWVTNQCGHAFLGVIVGLYASTHPIFAAIAFGGVKESADILRVPTKETAVDSLWDVVFWGLGAWVVSAQGEMLNVAVILMAFALLCGAIPRVRAAIRYVKKATLTGEASDAK